MRRAAPPAALLLAAIVAAVAAMFAIWSAGTALAHAQLIEVTPANGEVVAEAPTEVILRFSEPVSLTGGSVRVLDDAATVVSGTPVQSDETISVPLDQGMADGTYTIAYEVVSADSHRISGASVFSVGAATSGGLVDLPDVGGDVGWAVRLGGIVFSTLAYAGALVAVGLLALTIYADRARGPFRRPDGGDRLDRRWDATLVRAAVLGAVAMLAATPFRIARVGGGLDALRDNDLISASLGGPIGMSMIVTVVGLLAFAVGIDQRAPGAMVGAFGLTALVGFTLEGHTRAERQPWMITFDVVHLVAGAVWIGGIVGLIVAFRSSTNVDRLYPLVRRFSAAAVGAVLAVSVAGVVMAWIILPGVSELTGTGWGLALIVKVALVLVVISLGAVNNRKLVPAATSNGPDGADLADLAEGTDEAAEPDLAVRRLARIVTVEAVLLLAVVAVTSVLVTRSPVPSAAAPAAPVPGSNGPAATDGPELTTDPLTAVIELSGDGGVATVTVNPGRAGANYVEVMLRDLEGRVINPIEPPVVAFSQTDVGVGPLEAELSPIYIGDYEATIDLGFPGPWEISVRVRTGEFDSVSGTSTIELTE